MQLEVPFKFQSLVCLRVWITITASVESRLRRVLFIPHGLNFLRRRPSECWIMKPSESDVLIVRCQHLPREAVPREVTPTFHPPEQRIWYRVVNLTNKLLFGVFWPVLFYLFHSAKVDQRFLSVPRSGNPFVLCEGCAVLWGVLSSSMLQLTEVLTCGREQKEKTEGGKFCLDLVL